MTETVIYDRKVHTIRQVFELNKRGIRLLCPECNTQMRVLLDLEESRKLGLRPGIYCTQSSEHINVSVSPASVELLLQEEKLGSNRGWPSDCQIIAFLTNEKRREGSEPLQELELVQISNRGYILTRIKRRDDWNDYQNEAELYDTLDDLKKDLMTGDPTRRLAGGLENALLEILRQHTESLDGFD